MESFAEALPGQLLKSIYFGLCSYGSLSVSLRSWGATSCAFFSLYLQNCSPPPHLQGCWFPWRVRSPVCGLHLHHHQHTLSWGTQPTQTPEVWMCPFSSCLPLVQVHRAHHPGGCVLCVLRGAPGCSPMAGCFGHGHQELIAWWGAPSDSWWKLLSYFR